jgi:hypothetical protein
MKQGRAISTDVVQGSVESFLNALNKWKINIKSHYCLAMEQDRK